MIISHRLRYVLVSAALGGMALVIAGMVAFAQDEATERDLGEVEFIGHCAACHGEGGRGDGPVAQVLSTKPANLTEISKRNGGVFPADDVYRIIDGRIGFWAHGNQEMPVWGQRFRFEAMERLATQAGATDPEVIIRQRILSLVAYLESIQVD